MSLRRFLERIDRNRYEPIVACCYDVPEVLDLFSSLGIRTFFWPGIDIFPHTTGGWYSLASPLGIGSILKTLLRFLPSARATTELVNLVRPDIVHLNSLVLAPSAIGVKRTSAKLVWHIRESVHPGHLGIRRRWLRSLVTRLADEAVFICAHSKEQLMIQGKGSVIFNPVDFTRFDRHLDGLSVREELCLDPASKVVLFLGGISQIKGTALLLNSLPFAKQQVPELEILLAGIGPQSNSITARTARRVLPLIGRATPRQQFEMLLDSGKIRGYAHLLPFRHDPERLMAASDVVVAPFTEPHFGMPVVEAGAMGKPVIVTRIGGLEEAVVDRITGLVVPPNDPTELARAIVEILSDDTLAHRLGEAGYQRASTNHNIDINVCKVQMMYDRLMDDSDNQSKE